MSKLHRTKDYADYVTCQISEKVFAIGKIIETTRVNGYFDHVHKMCQKYRIFFQL